MFAANAVYVPQTSFTYATWNPSDKNAAITLSGGNLVATTPATTVSQVRATLGKSSGKWYWEVTGMDSGGSLFGIATSAASLSNWTGGQSTSWGYYYTGSVYNGGSIIAGPFGTLVSTDVMGFALDMSANTLAFYKNNVLQYTATIAAGTWYPALGQSGGAGSTAFTANFGASALTYSPPAGFNAGLYV